jgi:hypothetical protein
MIEKKSSRLVPTIMISFGALVCLWVAATVVSGLHQANWQVSELARQYMLATGMMKPMHTMVDFYSHIKGVEYLICVAFFVAFPVFSRYLNKEKTKVVVTR